MSDNQWQRSVYREDQPSRAVLRWRAILRLGLWHFYSKSTPLYLVTEFPKSGGTWYSKMLSECIDAPFPAPASAPARREMILRDTKLYNRRFHNISVMMRDGRDVMVSSYYHFLFPNEANVRYRIDEARAHLAFKDFDDIAANMPRFIEYMFEEFPKRGWSTRFSWADFVDSWHGRGVPTVHYEQLLQDPQFHMARMTEALTGSRPDPEKLDRIAQKYSFRSLTGRNAGETKANSFIRKGVAGDWKNHFTAEARKTFQKYGGVQLQKLGYETDDSWVDND